LKHHHYLKVVAIHFLKNFSRILCKILM